MKAYLRNQLAPGVVVLLSVVGMLYFAYDARTERDAADLVRARGYSPPPTRLEPCLFIVMPAFERLSLSEVTFDEGSCSKDSEAPVCEICGDDLSKLGRIKLLQLVGAQLVKEGKNVEK